MDEREKRDAEINKALEQAQRLIQGSDIPTQVQNHEDDIDDIINMVKVNSYVLLEIFRIFEKMVEI